MLLVCARGIVTDRSLRTEPDRSAGGKLDAGEQRLHFPSVWLLVSESCLGARFRFGGLFFAVFRRRDGFERKEKAPGHHRDFLDCGLKRGFICLGWLAEPADFPDELEGSRADFVVGGWRCEVKKNFDVSAHKSLVPSPDRGRECLLSILAQAEPCVTPSR